MGSIADLAQKIKLNAGVSNPRLAQIAASAAHAGRSNHYTRESLSGAPLRRGGILYATEIKEGKSRESKEGKRR